MPELKGKVAIVTGAGRLRGIGRASAVHLAQLGAHVVVTGTGRTSSQLPTEEQELGWRDIESTCEQIKSLGSKAFPLVFFAYFVLLFTLFFQLLGHHNQR